MGFSFINLPMLFGLAAVSLPLLVHMLSRRRYDVVQWGAMQFLELSRKTRRRLRLEELLLLLLRMGLIALIALALARPWLSGGIFSQLVSTQSRDVVFVVDSSYSMGWEGGVNTPQIAAAQWVHEFLDDLRPGDSVALLDSRDLVREVVDPPVQNFDTLREALDQLPEPSGTSDLAASASQAVQMLSRTTNLAREVVILTDQQKVPWTADDEVLWQRFDDLLTQPAVRPRVWAVNVSPDQGERVNHAVGRLQLSREITVPNFPIRVQTVIRSYGGTQPVNRRIYLEINGQRISEKTVNATLQPGGETPMEFEARLPTTGSWLISVVIDGDDLPGDDRSDAAITVAEAIPVLIVDGAWSADPTKRESFFAVAALSASENDQPWVRARAIPADTFSSRQLDGVSVVVLANVKQVTPAQTGALKDFVSRGGGLLMAMGDQADPDSWNAEMYADGQGLLPAKLMEIQEDQAGELDGVRVVDSSLDLPWMKRFRAENDGGFTEARFSKWWRVIPATDNPGRADQEGGDELPRATPPVVAARLNTSDSLLLTRQYGRGRVLLMTAPIDADWSTLPARHDFVAMMHEVVFHLASTEASRNVEAGAPLIHPRDPQLAAEDYVFVGPGDLEFSGESAGDELRPAVRLSDTRLPGVYRLKHKTVGGADEYFVVNGDRRESDLTPLEDAQMAQLEGQERMQFIRDVDDLKRNMFEQESPTEIWPFLLLVFVLFLIGELLMTRRLVRGGHAGGPEAEPIEEIDDDEIEEIEEIEDDAVYVVEEEGAGV